MNEMRPTAKLPLVYCAGKISCMDWRHDFAHELEWTKPGDLLDAKQFTYCGPYFVTCGGGGNTHNQRGHALVPPDENAPFFLKDPFTRDDVPGLCHRWLSRADLVFAWIDCTDCFGTLIELGWAVEQKKSIYVAFRNHDLMKEMWFVTKCPNVHSQVHDSPTVALRHALADLKPVHRSA